jgi:hypothetical protein
MRPEELAPRLVAFSTVRERLMQRITLLALAASQRRTPVRTGTLRRSETTRVEDGGAKGFVGTNIEYGPMVHQRVPFFKLGIEDATPQIERALQTAGDDFFTQVAR